ncbi:MAG: glycosyl hydrolase family 28-related protein [Bacteroidia bacterium]|nr:glycosyl hydrolase family 28-related protein [Bacteroidia bacterium]
MFYTSYVAFANDVSIYQLRPNDPDAVYFTSENFGIKSDGIVDVSDALQEAINQVKRKYNFGIVFLPEGTYRISKTIYIPNAIRLIGYGNKRPVIVLGKNTPGYQQEIATDKGKANYMFWFTGGIVEKDQQPRDAGAGTFYSALSNIDLRIEDGNPYAVALRTHFAQHSYIENVNIYIGKGKAGIFDVGNEMENVCFYGGDYGIYTTKTSPGWQIMMVDTYFEGQRKAAIKSQQSGLTIVRLQVRNVPTVIEIEPNFWDKIFMENCLFDNVSGSALIVSDENNYNNQISLRNIDCRKVPILVEYRRSNTKTPGNSNMYTIKNYIHGANIDSMNADPEIKTVVDLQPIRALPSSMQKDIPSLPAMSTWVNIRDLGAKGDGITDDTKVFREAIEKYSTIYLPQGWYVVSQTLTLKSTTCMIGLNPIATQIILPESTPAFSGFGTPKPLIEVPQGGKTILTGIGLNTGAYNYRAVGCKWMGGKESYMNDVKFVGGHGSMVRGPQVPRPPQQTGQGPKISSPTDPVVNLAMDKAWDNQYWSLWITNSGGGTFKDIWTASTYSANGIYVNNTSTEGRIYAMSIEHHVRNEAHFKNVSNWKVYAFQLEEESREGSWCQPVELEDCSNMVFANLYMFRVIRFITPYPYSVRTWNCKDVEFLNVHNYSQIKFTTNLPFYDINTDIEVRPWEFTRLFITGNEVRKIPLTHETGQVEKLAGGFEFAEGITRDSKGNIYFCEQHMRRIYKWDTDKSTLSLVANFPWEPLSLAFDTKDNLLVIFKYNPQPGYKVDGLQESVPVLPDAAGTSFSGWGNSGFATLVYSVNPSNPEETITLLPKVQMGSVKNVVKALYPSNRWRDSHDFNKVSVAVPENCFIAPDGVTIVPECYDLARSSSVLEATPGKPFYAADEYDKRMVKMDVDYEGKLSNLQYFVEQGEFGSAVDSKGNIYVADGQIYVYDMNGKKIRTIEVPERPTVIQFGGKNGNTLFITARSSLYSVRVE